MLEGRSFTRGRSFAAGRPRPHNAADSFILARPQASDVLGTQGEEKELLFQDLLQMQYENVKTMKLFGVATINVNLLIFLINKKFLNK